MDPLAEAWSPSVVFTPSTAIQRQSQAKDWQYVDQWLARHYGSTPIPHFERNPETLKCLMQLASQNEHADEQRRLERAVKEKALEEMRVEAEKIQRGPLTRIEEQLTEEAARDLQSLTLLHVAMGESTGSAKALAKSLLDLNKAEMELEQQSLSLDLLAQKLEREQEKVQKALDEIKADEKWKTPNDMHMKTTEWERNASHFEAKAQEYDARIAQLMAEWEGSASTRVLIPDIVAEEKAIEELKEQVLQLEAKAKGYQGLPANEDLARLEVERAEAELAELIQKREALYDKMVN